MTEKPAWAHGYVSVDTERGLTNPVNRSHEPVRFIPSEKLSAGAKPSMLSAFVVGYLQRQLCSRHISSVICGCAGSGRFHVAGDAPGFHAAAAAFAIRFTRAGIRGIMAIADFCAASRASFWLAFWGKDGA